MLAVLKILGFGDCCNKIVNHKSSVSAEIRRWLYFKIPKASDLKIGRMPKSSAEIILVLSSPQGQVDILFCTVNGRKGG